MIIELIFPEYSFHVNVNTRISRSLDRWCSWLSLPTMTIPNLPNEMWMLQSWHYMSKKCWSLSLKRTFGSLNPRMYFLSADYDVIRGTSSSAPPKVHVHPDCDHVCYLGVSNISLLNLQSFRRTQREKESHFSCYRYCAVSPGGKWVAYSRNRLKHESTFWTIAVAWNQSNSDRVFQS